MADVRRKLGLDPGRAACIDEGAGAIGQDMAECADAKPRHRADMRDDARCANRGRDVCDAAEHVPGAQHAREHLMTVDSVLERNHDAAPRDQRRDLRGRLLDVPQLDAEHHDIDRRERRRIVGGDDPRQHDVAARAFDAQAVRPHRGQMRAARDEGDLVAPRGELRAEIAADPAGADDRNAHRLCLLSHPSPTSLALGSLSPHAGRGLG